MNKHGKGGFKPSRARRATGTILMRSMLYVRGGDTDAVDAALAAGADALLIELPEDLGDAARLAPVKALLQAAQLAPDRPILFVRVPSIETPSIDTGLAALIEAEPDGIVLGGCRGGYDVQHLGVKLAVHEAEHGLTDGETPIIAEAGSTARALFSMGSYADASQRLIGLIWDGIVLAADLGTTVPVAGGRPAALTTARSLTLLAARAAEVSAIDGPSVTTGDAFRAECEQARQEGFNAKIAISADQVAIINAVFNREI